MLVACGHEHTWQDWTIEKAATCEQAGLQKRVCDGCSEVEEEIILPIGHVYTKDEAVPATCTQTGLTEGLHCFECQKVFVEQTVTPKLAHIIVPDEAVPATCTETGLTEGLHCSECKEVFVEQTVTPKLAHTLAPDEAVPATCTKTGLTEGLHCSECKEVFVEQTVTPKLAHTLALDEAIPATCTKTGLTEGLHCSECDEVILSPKVSPMTPHEEEVVSGHAATFLETGLTDGKRCKNCGETLLAQTVLEKLKHEDYGYQVAFDCDKNVLVHVYETQKYEADAIKTNLAYSRDGDTGELLMNGSGQVNFKLELAEGYLLDEIIITSGYKNLKLPAETGQENTYRITKITKNLTVIITSKKRASLEQFSSYTNSDGIVTFSWQPNSDIQYVNAEVTTGGVSSNNIIEGSSNTWQLQLNANTYYSFAFTPYNSDDVPGEQAECTKYFVPSTQESAFPRVEIVTQNNIYPSCDYIAAPAGCWGNGTTNKEYSQCVMNIYDADNLLVYSSNEQLNETDAYLGAKIKVRGNTSAYSEKKPYKIKLKSKADLLEGLIPDRTDKSYADKDWALLNFGDYINPIVGWSVSEALEMDWTPSYSYVVLYLNGDYRGLYILCESVKQGNGTEGEQSRCQVSDEGFVVELDAYWWNEDLYFTTPYVENMPPHFTFKYPDSDGITLDSVQYIQKYISDFEAALLRKDGSCSDYIDEESFAKWLLAHDILGTYDSGGSNIYLTKFDSNDDSKLKMGPLWDFDSIRMCEIESFANIRGSQWFYYRLLLQEPSFNEKYLSLFNYIRDEVVSCVETNIDKINFEEFDKFVAIDCIRWNTSYETIEEQKQTMLNWLNTHLSWMENELTAQ